MVDADEPYTGLSAKIPHLELDVLILQDRCQGIVEGIDRKSPTHLHSFHVEANCYRPSLVSSSRQD